MELKLQIDYNQLLYLLKQLPLAQLLQLKTELFAQSPLPKPTKLIEKNRLRALLLAGPVMSDEQYAQSTQTRKWINQWRTV